MMKYKTNYRENMKMREQRKLRTEIYKKKTKPESTGETLLTGHQQSLRTLKLTLNNLTVTSF